MTSVEDIINGQSTAESRWARIGPYYAMFPLDFAFDIVERHSNKGDYILDPFAGRFSSIFAGCVRGRKGLGIEINPVGWLYGRVKINPASKYLILMRLDDIYKKRNYYQKSIPKLHDFYQMCFCDEVLKFLLSERKNLNWKNNIVDATLMTLILINLHGKIGEGLSNQMKKTKAMGISYSLNWWKNNNYENPPDINPLEFLKNKIEWRYAKGTPVSEHGVKILHGDSTKLLPELAKRNIGKYSLLFTSPPYYSLTDYHIDQWLRLWLLGGNDMPKTSKDKYKNRFNNKTDYYNLLDLVFCNCSKMMSRKSTVYVRTDIRNFTYNTTLEILSKHFPYHSMDIYQAPVTTKTQTEIFGNRSSKKGEIDIILSRK
jgi:DNA modification methylase